VKQQFRETQVKYVLSDLDGVIRHFPIERTQLIEKRFSLPSGAIHTAAFEKNLLAKVVCGKISDEIWREEIVKTLSKLISTEAAKDLVHDWSNSPGIVDQDFLKTVENHFHRMPIAILTNATSRLNSDLNLLGIADRFYRVFNSSEMGVCKPDPNVFVHVIESLDCTPSEIFFIDDSLSHVHAAQELGIKSYHYTSLRDLRENIGSMISGH
jgi:HAD superfamily hydrolase (TIGR01509 family)